MPSIHDGQDWRFLREGFDELAPSLEEPVTYHKYTGTSGGVPAFGVAEGRLYDDVKTFAALSAVSVKDIQGGGGFYLVGDVRASLRYPAAGPDEKNGFPGDQFSFWSQRWRVVGLVEVVRIHGEVASYEATLRRV